VTTNITNQKSHNIRSRVDFAMIAQTCEKIKNLKMNLFRKQLGKLL